MVLRSGTTAHVPLDLTKSCISLSLLRLPKLPSQCYSNRSGNFGELGCNTAIQPKCDDSSSVYPLLLYEQLSQVMLINQSLCDSLLLNIMYSCCHSVFSARRVSIDVAERA